MSQRTLRNALATLVAAASLTFGGLANAVFYSSNFDPLGPLSFTGIGLFYLDDACLAVDGSHVALACNLQMISATVNVKDTNSNDTGVLNFGSNIADMVGLIISGGELVGVDTNIMGWVFASPCTGTICGIPNPIPWWIQWSSAENDPVFLYTGGCDGPCFIDLQSQVVAPHVKFTRVPEPGTLALLLGALGIGGLIRRRSAA